MDNLEPKISRSGKKYGKTACIRFLRCTVCREKFSERKHTALWNCKIPEEKTASVCEQLSEGTSFKGTTRLVLVDPSTIQRLNKRRRQHGQQYHDQNVQVLPIQNLQGDERHGFAGCKAQPAWEGELMDLYSKFVVLHLQRPRDEALICCSLADGAARLTDIKGPCSPMAMSAMQPCSQKSYAYQPPRQGPVGRLPKPCYRILRTTAHVQVIKHRQGTRLKEVEISYTHSSRTLIQQALAELGYQVSNTSAVERRNGTARLMSKAQVRKALAFAKREDEKLHLGWWGVTVYNWCRPHRTLHCLRLPQDKKSTLSARQPWCLD